MGTDRKLIRTRKRGHFVCREVLDNRIGSSCNGSLQCVHTLTSFPSALLLASSQSGEPRMMSAVRGRRLCLTKHIGRSTGLLWLTAVICGCFACPPTRALDRDRAITQFHHTAWLAREGAPSQINAVVQTTDGYLWFGSERGLFQFDGVQFKLFEPPAGIRFPSSNINSLMATPDGGLWISFNPSGIGFLKNDRFVLFDLPRFELISFVRDLEGRIWAGTMTGLLLLDGNDWLEIANDWNFTGHRIWTMFVDRSGTLWVAVDNTLVFLRRGSSKFQQTGTRVAGV